MGTPAFAVASLEALLKAGANIVAVVTAPDKPAGRGMKLSESAVKQFAVQHGLKVLQPLKLKDSAFLEELRALQADLQVVVAFRMLPEAVWNMPPLGTINLHASLLPQYRGAAPINWAVMNGEKETGLTTFQLQHEIDTGNILMQTSLPIGENETAGELHDRMMLAGAQLLVETVKAIAAGTVKPIPQEQRMHHTPLKSAPKIFTETCHINFQQSVQHVHNHVRGLSPYPGAFTYLKGKMLKIFRTQCEYAVPDVAPGTPVSDGKTYLKFACQDGYLHVLELQLEGKKKMLTADFLRGYRF